MPKSINTRLEHLELSTGSQEREPLRIATIADGRVRAVRTVSFASTCPGPVVKPKITKTLYGDF
jgi:hypothetical protein